MSIDVIFCKYLRNKYEVKNDFVNNKLIDNRQMIAILKTT